MGLRHNTVCHARGEYARDEDGDGHCEVHVNTMEGFWSLLRSWLRPHRGISQEKLPIYLAFFQFVHNARKRGKALLGALVSNFGRVIPKSTPRNPGRASIFTRRGRSVAPSRGRGLKHFQAPLRTVVSRSPLRGGVD